MNLDEVTNWKPFKPHDAPQLDLSFLDAHKTSYTLKEAGKPDRHIEFYVTYSFHCFAKEYEHQSPEEKRLLMYHAPKESRPFCFTRYSYAQKHLRKIIENMPDVYVVHAGYGSYACSEVIDDDGKVTWYFVPFVVYRYKKKLRLHVTSAYPLDEKPGGGKVRFFSIAKNLLDGKKLPTPRT